MTATDFIDHNAPSDASQADASASTTPPALEPPPFAAMPPIDAVPPAPRFRLVRSRMDRKLGGVCGGLAKALEIDVTLIRIVFVGGAFAGFGIPVYLAAWILAPREDEAR